MDVVNELTDDSFTITACSRLRMMVQPLMPLMLIDNLVPALVLPEAVNDAGLHVADARHGITNITAISITFFTVILPRGNIPERGSNPAPSANITHGFLLDGFNRPTTSSRRLADTDSELLG